MKQLRLKHRSKPSFHIKASEWDAMPPATRRAILAMCKAVAKQAGRQRAKPKKETGKVISIVCHWDGQTETRKAKP